MFAHAISYRKGDLKVGVPVMESKKIGKSIDAHMLDFLSNNVFSVTDITRRNKLTEILDEFSKKHSDEVYIIQNAKKKNAQGAFLDLDFFKELLVYKEAIDDALDQVILEEALLRKNEKVTLSLSDVFEEDDIDVNSLIKELELGDSI